MTDARPRLPARRRRFGVSACLALAPALLLAVCAAAAGEDVPPGGGPEAGVSVRQPPPAWVSRIAAPVVVDAFSAEGGTLRLVFTGDGARQLYAATLAPGRAARIELPLYITGDCRVEWTIGGAAGSGPVGRPFGHSDDPPPILSVNAFLMRELDRELERSGTGRTLSSVAARELPVHWQSYAGLGAAIVMDAADAADLAPAQASALAHWIRWFGGVLWLAGDGGEHGRALARLGLPGANAGPAAREYGKEAFFLNGTVKLVENAPSAASRIAADASAPRTLLDPRRLGRGTGLLENLGEIPVAFIIPALLLLGAFLGPVAHWIVRRRNNPLLFFLIVPLAALLGAGGIVAGAFLIEGAGGEYNRAAVLARDAGSDDAMLFDRRGVRPGFAVPEARFGAETLALPFAGSGGEKTIDCAEGVRLGAGWLLPRFTTGFLAARPVVCRMNVDLRRDGDGWAVVNNLGFRVGSVAARLPGGGTGWAENIPPGGTAALAPERGTRRYEELCRGVAGVGDGTPPVANVLLVAEADGLPYIDDGGIGGTAREERFFYVVGGNRAAPGADGGEGGEEQ